ncbi:Predicted ATP-dependent carboligase, ATP-grasp superfamily [Neorhodopirellula lusitana]|uniref:Predicted ATP-dependent carboligase, ATP-grasp superfamily n=1 Tax=Neorhodopirellula lusitana TaxID=445327 RepID=A0ABY1PUP5_9BACT|nr:ATP-grasp domain-containing protein [Neorhodopirellula lusitana]SMP48980.1 Predicted ATP-dependent carboligase, ATP-grasp superfamily [Neorhodopirellula lusitana]
MTSQPANQGLNRILVAGASVRWAAQSARRAGYSVSGIDLFGDTDTRAACDHFQLLDVTGDSPENAADQQIASFSAQTGAAVISVGGLSLGPYLKGGHRPRSKDPTWKRLQQFCRQTGFEFPETFSGFVDNKSHAIGQITWGRWLFKTIGSTGGLGVRFVDAATLVRDPHAFAANGIFQRYVPGRRYGVVALASDDGTEILGICRSLHQRLGDRPFVYAGSAGPIAIATESKPSDPSTDIPIQRLQRLAFRVAESENIRGLFNLDFVRDTQGRWWLLEVNARPSGSCEVIEQAAIRSGVLSDGQSLIQMHLNAINGNPRVIPWRSSHDTLVKRIVYSSHAGYFVRPSERCDSAQLMDVPSDGTPIQAGAPVATLLLRTERGSTPEVEQNAPSMRSLVRQVQAAVQLG